MNTVFKFIIKELRESPKGVFSKMEVCDFLFDTYEKYILQSCKDMQKEISEEVFKRRGKHENSK